MFKFGSDISPSINEWWNKIGIPQEERASFQSRLRRSKWRLNHNKGLLILTEVNIRFYDEDSISRGNICEFLREELKRKE